MGNEGHSENAHLAAKQGREKKRYGACSNSTCFMYWAKDHSLGFADKCPYCGADWEEVPKGGRKEE